VPRLALNGGTYQARSVIASAQRSLNLYPESMPEQQGEPAPFAHYPTPGLTLLATFPHGPIRGLRQATNGTFYLVAGPDVYAVISTAPLDAIFLGTIAGAGAGLTTPVSMQDNSETLVIVDGTPNGWEVDLASNGFSQISDPNGMFAGADRVDYLDTYLLFNKPGTPQFYSSDSLAVTFDPLYFADKSSYSDLLVSLAVAKREIWLIGERSTEVWYNAGTTDFPFGQIPSTFVDHGCIAKYSVAVYDNSVIWLTLDRQGGPLLMLGAGYQTKRISTYAVEQAWADYPAVSDAVGFIYLLGGHAVYALTFPTADHTWCYDISTSLWHEWLWVDGNGNEHRSRCNCAYPTRSGDVIAGDWENGNVYLLDHNNQTDNGQPIKRQRSWPHVLNDGKRVFHRAFIADFETGMGGPAPSQPQTLITCLFNGPDGLPVEQYSPPLPEINATWSRIDGAGAVLSDGAAIAANGNTSYTSAGPFPPMADYSIAFRVLPNSPVEVNGSSAMVAARAVSSPGQMSGYWGGIQIYGTVWFAQLMGATMPLGLPPPSGWFDCTLTAVGNSITLQVQRSSDGLYMGVDEQWHSDAQPALSQTDSTYTGPGRIMFGLNTIPTGVMGTEDATGTWVLEDNSGFSWEWDEVPTDSLGLDNIVATTIPSPWQLFLDWSDDRGHTFGNPVSQSMGGQGEYLTQAQWQRLGYSRDRVYRLTFTAPIRTALQGAWIEAQPAQS
jgi:hypothetical protein